MKSWPLVSSFVLFVALCVSAAYWAIQLFKPPVRAVAAPLQAAQHTPRFDAAADLFGGRSTFAVASNFQLKGAVVAGNPAESVAILSVNGKPARSVRINTEVAPGTTVKEVQREYVLLSEGGTLKRVELAAGTKAQMKVGISTTVAGSSTPQAKQQEPSN